MSGPFLGPATSAWWPCHAPSCMAWSLSHPAVAERRGYITDHVTQGRTLYHAMSVCQAVLIQALDAGLPRRQAGLQACDVVCAAAHVEPDLLLYPVPLSLAAPPWQGIEACGRHGGAANRPVKACLRRGCLHAGGRRLTCLDIIPLMLTHEGTQCRDVSGLQHKKGSAQGTVALHLLRLQHQWTIQARAGGKDVLTTSTAAEPKDVFWARDRRICADLSFLSFSCAAYVALRRWQTSHGLRHMQRHCSPWLRRVQHAMLTSVNPAVDAVSCTACQ